MPALVLLNPHARGGRAAALEPALRQALAELAPDAELQAPASVDAARQAIAAWPRGRRVVVVGGDGTLHQLLAPLHERGCELGLVPAGSGDDSARAFGLRGLRWRDALAHALQAPARPVDLGEVQTPHETRLFVSSLACGFDAAVALRALAGPPALAGLLRYLWATLAELRVLRLHRLQVQVDGRPVHDGLALFASTLNTPSYGGGMPVAPSARLADGRLDLLVAGRFGRAGALLMLPRLLAGAHLGHPRVALHGGQTITLAGDAELPLAADGEPMRAAAHLALRVRPQALQVVAGAQGHAF
ncbi:MAG: diacylglycerol kinase family protein [Rubrivivax sp.]